MKTKYLPLLFLLLYGPDSTSQAGGLAYQPKQYLCYQATQSLTIDGRPEEADWAQVPWTNTFVDIEGAKKPLPYFDTRVKMLWDEDYFYIAAELEEEDLWATYDQRDAVIFQENNFEVFIDPDGDTHNYYELEINALGTVWDLLLTRPYRDKALAINGWGIVGLKKGIHLSGTLNDPSDTDQKWCVELAIPWEALTRKAPDDGQIWRVNFSRVEWQLEKEGGVYRKTINPATGKPFPENNWVWSPQGVIAMHQPETWGFVQFTTTRAGRPPVAFLDRPDDDVKWFLRQVYYAERQFKQQQQRYTDVVAELDLPEVASAYKSLKIMATAHVFVAFIRTEGGTWYIREDGRVWKE